MRIVESGGKGVRGSEWCMRESPLGMQYLEYLEKKKAGHITSFPFNLDTPITKSSKCHSLDPGMPVRMKGPTYLWGLIPNPSLYVMQSTDQSPNASINEIYSRMRS